MEPVLTIMDPISVIVLTDGRDNIVKMVSTKKSLKMLVTINEKLALKIF